MKKIEKPFGILFMNFGYRYHEMFATFDEALAKAKRLGFEAAITEQVNPKQWFTVAAWGPLTGLAQREFSRVRA